MKDVVKNLKKHRKSHPVPGSMEHYPNNVEELCAVVNEVENEETGKCPVQ